jgi:hypothetical protein
LTELEQDPKVRGVVFASALKKNIFTAGNGEGAAQVENAVERPELESAWLRLKAPI